MASHQAEDRNGAETSRLAHRFAPIPDPTLLSLFPDPGTRYDLEQDTATVLGRDPRKASLVLFSPSVSQEHCKLVVDDDVCTLIDLGSSNGTYVNGEKLRAPRAMRQGDLITIGRYVFMYLWFRFAREPRPESIYVRDLKDMFVRIHPTPSSIQSLLIATNMFNVHVDLAGKTPEEIWADMLEELRARDLLGSLEMLVGCTARDHSGNRELRRVLESIEHWRVVRKEASLPEVINTDARNSARVVREILETFLETDDSEDSITDMLDEVIEEKPPLESPAPLMNEHSFRSEAVTPAELPFDLQDDESTDTVMITDTSIETRPRSARPRAQTDSNANGEWSVSTVEDAVEDSLSTLEPIDADLSHDAAGSLERRAERPRSDVDEDGARGGAAAERVSDGVDRSGEEATPGEPLSEIEPRAGASRPLRRGIGMLAAAAVFAGLVVAVLWVTGDPVSPTRAPKVEPQKASSQEASSKQEADGADVSGSSGVAGEPDTDGQLTEGASGEERVAVAPEEGEGSETKVLSQERAPATEAEARAGGQGGVSGPSAQRGPLASADVSSSASISLRPRYRVVNFLNDQGMPAYTMDTVPDAEMWDSETQQLLGDKLEDCTWVDGRKRKFTSKGPHIFLFTRCRAGAGAVEGWVNNRAMGTGS